MKKQAVLWFPLALMLLAGCSSSQRGASDDVVAQPPSPRTVQVYKSTGSVQCGNGGVGAPELALELVEAGISVSDASCGHDGLMRIAQCGAPDGTIAVFSIAQQDQAQAQQIGFSLLDELPSAQLMPCDA